MSNEVRAAAWRAMGSSVDVVVVGGSRHLLDLAETSIDHLERRWSRFLPDSDISRLNHAAGSPVHIDPATVVLLGAMTDGWRATNGAFDPTLLAPLVGLGYAASWHDPNAVTSVPSHALLRGDLGAMVVDPHGLAARLPQGMCLDAGGIGKGLAADLVAERLLEAGACGASVSIGGDVAVRGEAPGADGWLVGVADPFDTADRDAEIAQIALSAGGVATSGTLRRSWRGSDDEVLHHLLDPQTGRPVRHAREVVSVTVIAGTAAWAEVWTKAVMVHGVAIVAALDELGLGVRVAYADGGALGNSTWSGFAGPSVQQRHDLAGDEVEMVEV